MKKLILILVFLAVGLPARAQTQVTILVMGDPFNLVLDYNFSPTVVGCPGENCIKEFQWFEITKAGQRDLITVVPAPPGANSPVLGITHTVTGDLNVGPRKFTAVAVLDTGTELLISPDADPALAKSLPPPPTGRVEKVQ